MRRILTVVLVCSLSGVSTFAPVVRRDAPRGASSLLASAHVETMKLVEAQAQQDAYRPAGMSPAYFWTGIGLMAAGGLNMLAAVALNESDEVDDVCDDLDLDCSDISTAMFIVGAGMVGAGGYVYYLGRRKANSSSPQIVATPRRVTIQQRIGF